MSGALSLSKDVSEICENMLKSPSDVAACHKAVLDTLLDAHRKGAGGRSICWVHSDSADAIIRFLYNFFMNGLDRLSRKWADKFCIVALGGYGRRELSPKSDIDLMFLYSTGVDDDFKMLIVDKIAYPLWDTGLKLGHSSRTAAEAVCGAKYDEFTFTSMLDARFLCGNVSVFNSFKRAFNTYVRKVSASKIDELMRLKRDRHARYGWSAYVQEPNIKSGVGSLRDIHTLHWIAFLKRGSSDFKALARAGKMSKNEFRGMLRAFDFLLRVRNEAHFFFNRQNDLLDLESQSPIARNLGFLGDEESRAEELMRKVYFSLKTVDAVAKAVRKRMGIVLPSDVYDNMRRLGTRVPRNKKIPIDGFTIWRGEISTSHPGAFRRKPWRLVSVFRYAQLYSAVPGDKLELLIKDSRHYIDDSLRSSPRAMKPFLEIMTDKGNVAPVLELMHFWGILGAFVPEFGEITCRVQRELYHRYTADIHTLNAIAQLDRVFCAQSDDLPYWDYHAVLTSMHSPELAYLILFLHDIGKGDGIRGHAEIGAELAEKVLRRFGIPESDMQTVLFCVRNHLEMARFWQTHDLEDESCMREFAAKMPNIDCLKLLYVITFCDAMGTSDTFWNSYKQSLHATLYAGASDAMLRESHETIDLLRDRKRLLVSELLSMPEFADKSDLLLEHVNKLPKNYFMYHGRANLAVHIRMMDKLKSNMAAGDGGSPVLQWREDPNRSLISLSVVSTDRRRLFSTLSGVMSLSGLNILGSKILTREDGITIDTFYVAGISKGAIKDKGLRARLSRRIMRALQNPSALDSEIESAMRDGLPAPRVPLVSEVSFKDSSAGSVLEIAAADRPWLLYKISRAIDACGFDVRFAHIETSGKRVHDFFGIAQRGEENNFNTLIKRLRRLT